MPEELTTPLYSLGEKLFVSVCRSTSSAVTPTCISWSPAGSILNLSIFAKGNLLLHCISPSTWGNQRGELPLCIKQISGAVAGDSSLQDRGVAHYLFSLLFSLVSLPFSFLLLCPLSKIPKIHVVTMGSNKNPKLCDFTSHNNSGFICTPIAPPATSTL